VNVESLAQQLVSGAAQGPAAFGVALLGGLVAGFGPCILPMVPAVFGYITGTVAGDERETGSHAPLRALVLTAFFVLGMSAVFAVIGVAAGVLGHAIVFGRWAYYAVAAVCVVIALQLLDVISIPLDRLNALLPMKRPERRGLVGALLFGMLFGLVASPCSTPILAAIATLAAVGGDPVRGGALLFVYGLGKGVPLLLLGVASGSLGFMRRVSRATPALTKIGGVGLLVAAAYIVWIA
jgi:cytochrome c-type biogenesis protein